MPPYKKRKTITKSTAVAKRSAPIPTKTKLVYEDQTDQQLIDGIAPQDTPSSFPRKMKRVVIEQPVKSGPGAPRNLDPHQNAAKLNQRREYARLETKETIRDISIVPPGSKQHTIDFSAINWERRLACKADPVLDLKTYFPNIFSKPFGDGHEQLIHECETIIKEGGKKLITCPRRFGKTAICRGMIVRAMKYGLRQFLFFIGSKEPKAKQTLGAIQGLWHRAPMLQQDFPEFAYGIYRIGGRGGPGCQGQEYKGQRTYIGWSADEMMLPTLILDEEDVKPYQEHDPESVIYLPDKNVEIEGYIIRGAGCICRVAGIDGSIRGEADFHPVLLTQPRPDLIIPDDIIRDQKADSPTSSQKVESLIESVISYLSEVGVSTGILWPGTVIREGDPTDNYCDRIKHPEWQGDRISLIQEYPEGFDDDTIPQRFNEEANKRTTESDRESKTIANSIRKTNETDNKRLEQTDNQHQIRSRNDKELQQDKSIGKSNYQTSNRKSTALSSGKHELSEQTYKQGDLWTEYETILQQSLIQYGNLKAANEYYRKYQDELEFGFKVAWQHMHVQDSPNPDKNEVSTIQHAMNRRFMDHPSFLSEIQNRPKSLVSQGTLVLTAGFIREKQSGIGRNELSFEWNTLVCLIDTQGEILFYTIFACDKDFNGQFIDYGVFPHINTNYFRKSSTYGWKLLSKLYRNHDPEHAAGIKRLRNNSSYEAPLEGRIYNGLKECTSWLLNREFVLLGNQHQTAKIQAIGIDTKWGQSAETVKRFVRELADRRVMLYEGHAFGPGFKQLEEYEPRAGWLFEHQIHPHVKESKWCIKPYEKSQWGQTYIQCDVNRQKSFLMRRLATPQGSNQGCVSLFHASPDQHKMFAEHLADSQYPEPKPGRGMIKDMWLPKPGGINDDDFLDTATGCITLASICGASIKTQDHQVIERPKSKTLRELYEERKKREKQ